MPCPTEEQTFDRFAERYDIPGEQVSTDVRPVAEALTAHDLAHACQSASRRRW
ncbi:hypothetical protein [Streptomyces celluloflavus]|uniref:hypothetical protein n=1 Tax=Streptomyces celluloflavus TaxID=58344 RepID=UPI003692F31A